MYVDHILVFSKEKYDMAPIKIEVDSIDTKFAILKAAKKLEQINFKYKTKISIGQDLTIIERQNHKKLWHTFNVIPKNIAIYI